MYYKLSESELERIKRVSNMTCTDYELLGDFIPADSLVAMVEDLLTEVDNLQEKYDDLERDLQDNYKPISYAEQVGFSERDFY